MQLTRKFVLEHRIDRSLPGDARHAGEDGRLDQQIKMAFALRMGAHMARVAVAIVLKVQPRGLERAYKFVAYQPSHNAHRLSRTMSILETHDLDPTLIA
jgi:hypothetical protein